MRKVIESFGHRASAEFVAKELRIAIENADIALMTNNLNLVSYLVNLGKKCLGKIQFNIAFAVIVKLLFLMLAIAGRSNLVLAIFADVGVTVLVILNSLALYRYDRKLMS